MYFLLLLNPTQEEGMSQPPPVPPPPNHQPTTIFSWQKGLQMFSNFILYIDILSKGWYVGRMVILFKFDKWN